MRFKKYFNYKKIINKLLKQWCNIKKCYIILKYKKINWIDYLWIISLKIEDLINKNFDSRLYYLNSLFLNYVYILKNIINFKNNFLIYKYYWKK